MPLPLLAIGLGLSGLGSLLKTRNERKDATNQQRYSEDWQKRLLASMPGGPSSLETWGQQMLMGGQGFNMGQDGIMQSMRSDPTAKSSAGLEALINGQGNPFDTSALFESLMPIDERNINSQVAAMNAGAAGLGQRFSGYNATQGGELRRKSLEDIGARNAGLAFQSHEGGQARLLQALGLLSGNEQFGAELGFNEQGQQMNLLQLLLGAESARSNQGLQAMLAAGQFGQPVSKPSYGSVLGDLGQGLSLLPLLQNQGAWKPYNKQGVG